MLITVTGSTSGTSPYNIYICDATNTSCFYVSGVTSIPPSVIIDSDNYFPNEDSLHLKIIDGSMCEKSFDINCIGYLYQNNVVVIFMDGNDYLFQ